MVTASRARAARDGAPPADATEALAAVALSEDVLEYAMRCVLALAPQLSAAIVEAADRQVRGVFSGSRPYISRIPGEGRSARNEAIRRDHRAGERTMLLSRRYGLSERRIRQIVEGGNLCLTHFRPAVAQCPGERTHPDLGARPTRCR